MHGNHSVSMKIGRNDPCHCGSGKKYKFCHLPLDEAQATPTAAVPREPDSAENSPTPSALTELEEGLRVLQELQGVGDKKKKAEIEKLLAQAAPIVAYTKRQPEIEAAAATLESHREEFEKLSNDSAKFQEKIEALFAEERFVPLRFTIEQIQRGVDHAGTPIGVPKDKLAEHLRGMILYLADKSYRTSAAIKLLLAVPDFVEAGRPIEGCVILSCARKTTEAKDEANPFLWQMFVHGYHAWTAAKQARLGAQLN